MSNVQNSLAARGVDNRFSITVLPQFLAHLDARKHEHAIRWAGIKLSDGLRAADSGVLQSEWEPELGKVWERVSFWNASIMAPLPALGL